MEVFMAQINIKIDDAIKKKAEGICMGIGLTLTAAISVYLCKLIRERRIPFELSLPEEDKENSHFIKEVNDEKK